MSAESSKLPVTSSTEPAWADDARECYEGVLQALQEARVPFAVSGGFAFHHHTGIWRATKDLDLVLTPDAVPAAFKVLQCRGFETWIEDPVWLAKARHLGYFVDLITGVGNATLTVEESWIERAIPDRMLGIRCKVLRAEEMIASKLFVTRRERFDGADIAHLVKACSQQLDWDRLLSLAGTHRDILYWHLVLFATIYPSQVGLVPADVWRSLTEDFKRRISHPDPDEPFRGSLIDPKMFAIDVDEWGQRDLLRELSENYPHLLQIKESGRNEP
ncbi:MAG: nucleotidyltransferase [Terracidiphilus sp.]